MSKKEKLVIPKLRFSQFKNDSKWAVNKFGKLVIPVEEKAGTKKYILMSVTSGVGLVSQKEKFGREIAGNAYKNYYVIKKNDFAYNKSATKQFPEGYISMLTEYEETALPNSIFTCFRIVDEESEPRFFDHLFHNNYHGTWLRKYIEVGARAHGSLSVDTKHLWNMPIALPKLPEQQKIADCLSSLDDLIAAEDKKLSALKDHKKGLMQKLFPADGKTVPEWRFLEFRDGGEWERKALKDISPAIFDGTHQTPKYTAQGVPFYSVENVVSGNKNKFTSREDYLIATGKNRPEKGDIIITRIGKIGFSMIVDWDSEFSIYVTLAVIKKSKEFHSHFLHCYLQSEAYQSEICNKSLLNAVPCKINMEELRKTHVLLPKNPKEQLKISDCLSALDKLIIAQSEKVETLKTHKRGLMQGLFPSIEEVEA